MLTTMGILARTLNLDIAGTTATVEKEMTTSGPRQIQRLRVKVRVPREFGEEDMLKLRRAAETCPVMRSLHPDVEVPLEMTWGG
jgi:putative redox protein